MNNKAILGLGVAWLAVAAASTIATRYYFERQTRQQILAARAKPSGTTIGKTPDRQKNTGGSLRHRSLGAIVAEYSIGRRQLEQVLSHYDNGALTDTDRAKWQAELNRRRQLLAELEKLSANLPAGAQERRRCDQLKQILTSAISIMEQFAANESSANRAKLSSVSRRNSQTLRSLKKYYRVR